MSRTDPVPAGDGEVWRYEHPVVVVADDIDVVGHANNVVYLRWVQEAATAHWYAAVPPEVAARTTWAVVRHEIDYKKPAFLGEHLVVQTWVGELSAATFERFCEVHRPADGQLLARTRTVWCVIDPNSGRPRRIDPTMVPYFYKDPPEARSS